MKYLNQKPLTLFKTRGLQIKDHYSFIRLANTKKLVNTEVGEEYGSMTCLEGYLEISIKT